MLTRRHCKCRRHPASGELQDAGATIVAEPSVDRCRMVHNAVLLAAPVEVLQRGNRLLEECFGPVAVVVEYDRLADAIIAIDGLQGALAGSIMISEDDPDASDHPQPSRAQGRARHRERLADWRRVHVGAGTRRSLARDHQP